MLMDMMSDAAMELKTRDRGDCVGLSVRTLCRKESLLHSIREHIEGQLSVGI